LSFGAFDSEYGGFSQLKLSGPTLSAGVWTNASGIGDYFSRQTEKYIEKNKAVAEDTINLLTKSDTRKQAVTSYVLAELKDKKKNIRKMSETIYNLPNKPNTGRKLYGLTCM
jgi:hypothetical protein